MISFILPVKNRSKNLNKILLNSRKVFKNLKYEIIVIDASDKKIADKNKKIVKKYGNVRYFIQKSTRITRGCFEILKYLKYDFVTFLYDDDIMGPYVFEIYKNFITKKIFSMGTGIVLEQENSIFKFKKIKKIEIDKNVLLSNYFGLPLSKYDKRFTNVLSSPVSPICTCFKKQFIFEWEKKIKKFVKNNKFRNHYLLELDIGPDLITYLTNIHNQKKKVHYYLPPSVRFSSHQDSISIIYGKNNLRIGYWLARISFLENEKIYNQKMLNRIYTYLLFIGICLLLINIFNNFNRNNIFLELLALKKIKNYKFSLSYFFKIFKILSLGRQEKKL